MLSPPPCCVPDLTQSHLGHAGGKGLSGLCACQQPLGSPWEGSGCPPPFSPAPFYGALARLSSHKNQHAQAAISREPFTKLVRFKSTTFRSTHHGGLSLLPGLSQGTHREAATETALHPRPEGGESKQPGMSSAQSWPALLRRGCSSGLGTEALCPTAQLLAQQPGFT